MANVVYQIDPARVLFGPQSTEQVRDEVARLERSRVLLITSPSAQEAAARIEAQFPAGMIARFDDAQTHTPAKITEQALTVLRAHAAVRAGPEKLPPTNQRCQLRTIGCLARALARLIQRNRGQRGRRCQPGTEGTRSSSVDTPVSRLSRP